MNHRELRENINLICWWLLIFAALAFLCFGCAPRKPFPAKYDGYVWSCPKGTDTWVRYDQDKAKRYVYCVPKTKREREGIEQ